MKKFYFVSLAMALFMASACTNMTAGVNNAGIYINQSSSVVKGTPEYVGSQIGKFKEEMAKAKFFEEYEKAVVSGDDSLAAKLLKAISEIECRDSKTVVSTTETTKKRTATGSKFSPKNMKIEWEEFNRTRTRNQ